MKPELPVWRSLLYVPVNVEKFIDKAHTRIDWTRPAEEVVNLVRGMAPRPGAHTLCRQRHFRIARARLADQPALGPPGQVSLGIGNEILVAAGSGAVEILRAQLEGKKELPAKDLLNGRALGAGDVLG